MRNKKYIEMFIIIHSFILLHFSHFTPLPYLLRGLSGIYCIQYLDGTKAASFSSGIYFHSSIFYPRQFISNDLTGYTTPTRNHRSHLHTARTPLQKKQLALDVTIPRFALLGLYNYLG